MANGECQMPKILTPLAFGIGHLCLYLLDVNLRTLESAAEVDVDGLPFRKHVQRGDTGLAMAVPGVLRATERQGHLGANPGGGDAEKACIQSPHRPERPADIPGCARRRHTAG